MHLELQKLPLCLVQVTEIRGTLVRELLVVVVNFVLLVLLGLLAHEELLYTWKLLRPPEVLVPFSPWYLLPIVVQHRNIAAIIRAAERDYLVLPMALLAQETIDLVVEVAHLIVCKTG